MRKVPLVLGVALSACSSPDYATEVKTAYTNSEGHAIFFDNGNGEKVDIYVGDTEGIATENALVTFYDANGFEGFVAEKKGFVSDLQVFPHNSSHVLTLTSTAPWTGHVYDRETRKKDYESARHFSTWAQSDLGLPYLGCEDREDIGTRVNIATGLWDLSQELPIIGSVSSVINTADQALSRLSELFTGENVRADPKDCVSFEYFGIIPENLATSGHMVAVCQSKSCSDLDGPSVRDTGDTNNDTEDKVIDGRCRNSDTFCDDFEGDILRENWNINNSCTSNDVNTSYLSLNGNCSVSARALFPSVYLLDFEFTTNDSYFISISDTDSNKTLSITGGSSRSVVLCSDGSADIFEDFTRPNGEERFEIRKDNPGQGIEMRLNGSTILATEHCFDGAPSSEYSIYLGLDNAQLDLFRLR